jgi:deoxyribodipyrimidine photo-lyase
METLATRTRQRNQHSTGEGPVLYWMQRDQRVKDNWALLYAQKQALARAVPLVVLVIVPPSHRLDTLRGQDFMFTGLKEVQTELEKLHIPLVVLAGRAHSVASSFVAEHAIGEVVGDFNPLDFIDRRKQRVADSIAVRYTEVDTHNIIPCWVASDKEEFAAHTFRPKVHRQLPEFLVDIPAPQPHPHIFASQLPTVDWSALATTQSVDDTVLPVDWLQAGGAAAQRVLRAFIKDRLNGYDSDRNNPNLDSLSNLSPYLRYGQISAQRVALEVHDATAPKADKEAFLEELIVRRELTDNYCYYNERANQVAGAHEWAQKTIAEHKDDKREYVYTFAEFETAKTHDELWNAMQRQMMMTGKMHGWCRMYWAKKILEWTPDVQTAIDTALDLNDKYELDGCDPNGVVGVMWSICGVHDRAWTERPVFGKIRYMNFNGAKRKFDVTAYIERYGDTSKLFDE